MKKSSSPVTVQTGKIEFIETNSAKPGLRSLSRSIRELKWAHFVLAVVSANFLLNFPPEFAIRQIIDETSPLHGVTPARAQNQTGNVWGNVRFGHLFVALCTNDPEVYLVADYSRIHETRPVPVQAGLSPSTFTETTIS